MKGLDLKINQIVIYYVDTKISTEYSATNISFFVYISKKQKRIQVRLPKNVIFIFDEQKD